MWLGILFFAKADGGEVEHSAILVAYERHRLFSAGGPVAMAPQIVQMLREANRQKGDLQLPRCGSCGELLEVPPLEDLGAACASA